MRIPYQLQLGPIFGWGFLLAGGRLHSREEVLRFALVFACFHLGCFGGLTALNSFYDRDETPVGGMWNPPAPPKNLFAFAWMVQLAGLLPLLVIEWKLAAIYIVIVALALGYSHPRTRWKGNPFSSLAVVALGQGALDFCAGAFTVSSQNWNAATWLGMSGATLCVMAFYPLTQLYQVEDDARRGDRTLAGVLAHRGRDAVFDFAATAFATGVMLSFTSLSILNRWLDVILFVVYAVGVLGFLWWWRKNCDGSSRDDFRRVHFLLRVNALAFGIYLTARLVF